MRGFKRVWDEERRVWKYTPTDLKEKEDTPVFPKIEMPEIEIPWGTIFAIFFGVVMVAALWFFLPIIISSFPPLPPAPTTDTVAPGTDFLTQLINSGVSFPGLLFIISVPIITWIALNGRYRRVSPISILIWILLAYIAWVMFINPNLSISGGVTP